MTDGREFQIQTLGSQGDGIAEKADGTRVFVPGGLPGEIWRQSDDKVFLRCGPASEERQEPSCTHYQACGGCVAQHMSPSLYRDWKHQLVSEAIGRENLEAKVLPLWSVAPGTRQRATFHMLRRGDEIDIGFYGRKGRVLFDMTMCPVLAPEITAALPPLRDLGGMLLPANGEADVAVTQVSGGLQVVVDAKKKLKPLRADEKSRLAGLAKSIACLHLTINGEIFVARRAATLQFGKATVDVTDAPFLQAVRDAEAKMQKLVLDGLAGAKSVADIFCGAGTFTLPLAENARVTGYDNDGAAIDALDIAARHTQGLKPVAAQRRDLFRHPLGAGELKGIDGVVINPPRAGAKAQCGQLAAATVPRIVMVSCNPATFARDARILVNGGYVIGPVTPIDQFLWSPHVELVAMFTRR